MSHVVLQPSGGVAAQRHYDDTIRRPVVFAQHRGIIGTELATLGRFFPSGAAPMWGVTPCSTSRNPRKSELNGPGDLVLFSVRGSFCATGTVAHSWHNAELAHRLWSEDENSHRSFWGHSLVSIW